MLVYRYSLYLSYNITLSDTSTTATTLNTLDASTTGSINAGTITSLTGSTADLNTAYASSGITGLDNKSIIVNSETVSVSNANTLGALTKGILTATVAEGDMNTLKRITESGNALTVNVTDTSVAANELTKLDEMTTVAVRVKSATLTGTNTEKLAAYSAYKAGTIIGLDTSFDAYSYLASKNWVEKIIWKGFVTYL